MPEYLGLVEFTVNLHWLVQVKSDFSASVTLLHVPNKGKALKAKN